MGYSPNNPLVPGDPYSYDLKWIVKRIKEFSNYYNSIDNKIENAIITALSKRGEPTTYYNVADMIAHDPEAGSLCYVLGFYAEGDKGNMFYYITTDYNEIIGKAFYVPIGSNKWALPIITTEAVLPEMFGAVGDGSADDTEAVKAAFALSPNVVLIKNYLITEPLTFTGSSLSGFGSLICGQYTRIFITITTSGVFTCHDITIDGNNNCAVGIDASCDIFNCENVKVKNIQNINTDNFSCIGINSTSRVAHIINNDVRNVIRNTSYPSVYASRGLSINTSESAYVVGNRIENISCTIESSDCDGISCSFIDSVSNSVLISNNTIINATGRFIKSQAQLTSVINNRCINNMAYTVTNYYQPISIQYGSGIVKGNYIEMGPNNHRSHTHCIAFDSINNETIIDITDNIITSTSANAARSLLYIAAVGAGSIALNIEHNNVAAYHETMIYLTGTDTPVVTGTANIQYNYANIYQVFESFINSSIRGIFTTVMNNVFITSGTSRFSGEPLTFDNLIFRNNSGIREALWNDCDYSQLQHADFYYAGGNAMTNLPAALGDGTKLILRKNGSVYVEYCDMNSQTTPQISAI